MTEWMKKMFKQLLDSDQINMRYTHQSGQVLVTLLFFSIFAITIISAAIVATIVTSTATSDLQQGVYARSVAESGVENAILRLLRNPAYTGEVLTVDTGTATITVTPGNPAIIVSKGQAGDFIKTIQAQVVNSGGIYTVTSWREIY